MTNADATKATPGTPVNGSGVAIKAIPAFLKPPLNDGGFARSLIGRFRVERSEKDATSAFSFASLEAESSEERIIFLVEL